MLENRAFFFFNNYYYVDEVKGKKGVDEKHIYGLWFFMVQRLS